MKILTWHELSSKNKAILAGIKELTLVMGSAFVEAERLQQIAKQYSSSGSIIFGSLMESQIPELSGVQFAALPFEQLRLALTEQPNTAIMRYMATHANYIIAELKPKRVIWLNGSWSRVLHYREEFWSAFNAGADVQMLSPFVSESSARKYSQALADNELLKFEKQFADQQKRKLSDAKLLALAESAKALSWDWDGQTGAVIARAGRLLSFGYNKVLPYDAAEMHEGSLRDQLHVPLGERLEYYQTNHAEISAILRAQEAGYKLKGATLYTSKFPCPFCARVIADTKLAKVVYSGEHTNKLGYKLLDSSDKVLEKHII